MKTEQIIFFFLLIVVWFISLRVSFKEGYNAALSDLLRVLEDHDVNEGK